MDDVVEIWEAVLTFLFFPILVCIVYAADHNFFLGNGQVAPDEQQDVESGGEVAAEGAAGDLGVRVAEGAPGGETETLNPQRLY